LQYVKALADIFRQFLSRLKKQLCRAQKLFQVLFTFGSKHVSTGVLSDMTCVTLHWELLPIFLALGKKEFVRSQLKCE
jgi:hypothetical protein